MLDKGRNFSLVWMSASLKCSKLCFVVFFLSSTHKKRKIIFLTWIKTAEYPYNDKNNCFHDTIHQVFKR